MSGPDLLHCPLCEKLLSAEAWCTLTAKGQHTVESVSNILEDGIWEKMKLLGSVSVHLECRKYYTSKECKQAKLRKKTNPVEGPTTPVKNKLRSQEDLDLKEKCLFCFENMGDKFFEEQKKKPQEKRTKYSFVKNPGILKNILDQAKDRNDKWAQNVQKRIKNVSDLLSLEAIYHRECFAIFFSNKPCEDSMKRGRPADDDVSLSMEEIYSFLESSDECQFSLNDLRSVVTDRDPPNDRTIVTKLKERYGDDIKVISGRGKETLIFYTDAEYEILRKYFEEHQATDPDETKRRIVKLAASITREEIRTKSRNTKFYPSCNDFTKDAKEDVSEYLYQYLTDVIGKGRKGDLKKIEKQIIAIGHAIEAATRPRSFISSIQLGVGLYLHRKFESRTLIDVLSRLGFCSSYHDVTMFEASSLMAEKPQILEGGFIQNGGDNADFNLLSMDGFNTIHIMGSIQCVTPSTAISTFQPIAKLNSPPTAEQISLLDKVPIQTFDKMDSSGLKELEMHDVRMEESLKRETQLPSNADVLWMCGKYFEIADIGGWNGFMQKLTGDYEYETSRVLYLPFIHQPPGNHDTILTLLVDAAQRCKANGQKTCFITFDHPLYMKAKEIISSLSQDPLISTIVVRLGGFHLLLSFLGCIGDVMQGSGLKEAISVVYAPSSVDKILTGHAYSRAVRAHSLIYLALGKIILNIVSLSTEERFWIEEQLKYFDVSPPTLDSISDDPYLLEISARLQEKMSALAERGSTAKLWLQYFKMVTLMKKFIQAERMGDWNLHLNCIADMIPYFHASGHLPYAKASHIYLQEMLTLQSRMTEVEYNNFANKGYFTIKRADRFWAGLWSDMIIECTLMRGIKSVGGLTRGRGMTESVTNRWILSMPAANAVCDALEEFAGVSLTTSEQHVDSRESRIQRDDNDVKKILRFFSVHDPFPDCKHVMSITSGIVGDEKINCFNAYEIGTSLMEEVIGKKFHDLKLKRSNKVVTLGAMNSCVKVHENLVQIDPLQLFHRIAIAKKSDEQLQTYLEYELSPHPLSLFDSIGLRKTQKSAVYSMFSPMSPLATEAINLEDPFYVIDGGFLLHRVVWPQQKTFEGIFESYVNHVKNKYRGNVLIVFDGYDETETSTKGAERLRRYMNKSSADIMFDKNTTVPVSQEKFLSNHKNKSLLISMLSEALKKNNIAVETAKDDADTTIVGRGLENSLSTQTIVVGEDVDLLILMIAFAQPESNIFFLKPGRGKVHRQLFSPRSIQSQHKHLKDSILFAHAFSGSDTTSAIFQKGKQKIFKLLEPPKEKCGENIRINAEGKTKMQKIVEVFNSPDSSHDSVFQSGLQCFLALYGAPENETSLNNLRFTCYLKSASASKLNLASLPPSEEAARQHCYRVYHQIQLWRGCVKPPTDWGWRLMCDSNILLPIQTLQAPAPEELLKTISCKCTKGCTAGCGCRKVGLKCSKFCAYCQGDTCLNSAKLDMEEESDNSNEREDGLFDEANDDSNNPEIPNFSEESQEEESALASEALSLRTRNALKKPRLQETL